MTAVACLPHSVGNNGKLFVTKHQLKEILGLNSTRIIDMWVRKKMIPVVNAGHRTKLFQVGRVLEALQRLEIQEVGRR